MMKDFVLQSLLNLHILFEPNLTLSQIKIPIILDGFLKNVLSLRYIF